MILTLPLLAGYFVWNIAIFLAQNSLLMRWAVFLLPDNDALEELAKARFLVATHIRL